MIGGPRPRGEPLVVGVTGHRWVGPATTGLVPAVDALLTRLGRVARVERRELVVVSSLAEGADRVVARSGLAHRAGLEVVLPLEPADYATDFPLTTAEFDALRGLAAQVDIVRPVVDRTEAYLAAGLAVLARSDLLVAVWDGLPSRGRGGTAEIVERARASGYPLAWFHVERADGGEHGTLTATHEERWPYNHRQ